MQHALPKRLMNALFAAALTCAAGLACLTADGAMAADAPASPNPLDAIPEKMPFDVPYGAPVTLGQARVALDAAVAEARRHDWKLNVAVVDAGGNLVAFERMDGAQTASIAISEHKARAAAGFRRPTRVFEDNVQLKGMVYSLSLDGAIASRGGIPLVLEGKLVGAIGCSGGTGSQDEVVCTAGAAALH